MAFPFLAAATIGGQLLGGFMGARSAKRSAKIQAQAQREALQFQRDQMEASRRAMQPYVDAGDRARARYAAMFGIGPDGAASAWDQTEAYRAGNDLTGYGDSLEAQSAAMAEGDARRRMMGMAGASGQLLSGRVARGLADNRNRADLQGQFSYLTRRRGDFGNYMNYLGGVADQGYEAVGGQLRAGQGFANAASQATSNIGSIRAQGVQNASQAWQNAIGEAMYGFGNYMGNRRPPPGYASSMQAHINQRNMNAINNYDPYDNPLQRFRYG